jgi:hypothetical protein
MLPAVADHFVAPEETKGNGWPRRSVMVFGVIVCVAADAAPWHTIAISTENRAVVQREIRRMQYYSSEIEEIEAAAEVVHFQ